jgi:phosphoglycolate phosphatase
MKKTAIFDLDGTLLYTLDDLTYAVNTALELHKFPQRTLEEIKSFVGNGVIKLIQRALPEEHSKEDFNSVFNDFIKTYENNNDKYTHPYEGINELLTTLKKEGFNIAINSNKHNSAVQKLHKTLFPQVDIAIGAREGIEVKPNPQGVFDIIKALNCSKETTFFIGDSDVDIKTAKNANITSIGVTWGYRSMEYLKGADFIANNTDELLDILLKR